MVLSTTFTVVVRLHPFESVCSVILYDNFDFVLQTLQRISVTPKNPDPLVVVQIRCIGHALLQNFEGNNDVGHQCYFFSN